MVNTINTINTMNGIDSINSIKTAGTARAAGTAGTAHLKVGAAGGRGALRALTLTVGAALTVLLMSSPAFAAIPDDGDDPGAKLSVAETLGLFVVAPVVLFLLIAGAVMVTDKSRKHSA